MKLWYHESARVLRDRLINDTDRDWFDQLLRDVTRENFSAQVEETVAIEELFFGDFCNTSKEYQKITNVKYVSFGETHDIFHS